MADIPEKLIDLERSAEEARRALAGLEGDAWDAQWKDWYEAALKVQTAITEHAKATETSRYELECAVKRAVRHPELD